MKKLVAITAVALFAASSAAWAGEGYAGCGGLGKVAQDDAAPITTALDSGPITPKPATTKSGG